MATLWTLDGLGDRIKIHSDFIDSVINLIPPKHYFKNYPNISDDEDKQFQYNKRKKFSKKVLNEQRKINKKLKFDPNNLKTVTDIQLEKLSKNKEKNREESEELGDDKSVEKNDELKASKEKANELSEESDELKSDSEDAQSPSQRIKSAEHVSNPSIHLSISERLARLRLAKHTPDSNSIKSNRKGKNRSKNSQKKERKAEKQKKIKISTENNSLEVKDDFTQGLPGGSNSIHYAKFEFDDNKKKKKLDNVQLMNKLKNKAEKFEKLKKEDPDKAAKLRENEAWSKALQKAQGKKIKDDPKLLKKTIKKINFKKKSSEKTWKERIKAVDKAQAERQQKRTANIQARIDAKKNKKRKKS
ncbi:16655_t:CDS:2 [Dentiscutata heterogama]|uniref:16655_t:CDS:1 n=1 Tax=Dentiscutata heterogama TaxID=1316150 RepID=A0ACA9K1P3_9GLOM|nr:16655_t:CDS:2 [Dentiscutata heterogama]